MKQFTYTRCSVCSLSQLARLSVWMQIWKAQDSIIFQVDKRIFEEILIREKSRCLFGRERKLTACVILKQTVGKFYLTVFVFWRCKKSCIFLTDFTAFVLQCCEKPYICLTLTYNILCSIPMRKKRRRKHKPL